MKSDDEVRTTETAETLAEPRGPLRKFQVLGRNFSLLWSATVTSDLGNGLRLTAVPLLASRITDDPVSISLVSVASGLPWILFSLVGGAVVDRMDRRQLMIRAMLVQAATVFAFAVWVAVQLPPIAVVYALVFILTTCEVFASAAGPSLLPRLVGKQRLPDANGLLFAGQITAKEMVGPPLGGLIAASAIAVAFFVDASSYLIAALLVLLIAGRFVPDTTAAPGKSGPSIWRSAGEGLSWVWRNRFVRYLMVGFGIANLTRAMTTSIFVLFALDVLHVEGLAYGVLWATASVGALLGSFAVGWLRRFDEAKLVVAAMFAHGIATAGMGLTRSAFVVAAASVLFGFATMVWNIIGISAQQKVVPDALMGRVMSVDQLVTWGTVPIGALIGGLLADRFGLRTPIVAGGLLMIVVAVLIGPPLFRAMRLELARSDEPAEDTAR
jgi:MFS family permease